ncbi:ABC transporter ATP-binding protein [Phaeovibrio sulfidiphilus]|uniref:ABC transporter ATP-binding protein n=1 Tax=Phaeovibrio sulfidiphilus TaxID=1220600 RepID=A0A8J6YNS4_9PROT|nr:ABC transporter ATP-binding protein [Phaeovibrio sulfidiphilus]MBE1236761.1 ABC transporter ATP-binding protein [Phaeovibrio sulfidiphilus]
MDRLDPAAGPAREASGARPSPDASGAGLSPGGGACVLEARGLGFAYPEAGEVLRGVDLSLHAGERLVLAGANGSGKTTLLLLLAGLLTPREGTLLCDGQPRGRSRRAVRAWHSRVGLVFQDPDDQLFAPTVFEDVSFGPLNQGCDAALTRQRVDRALAALGIADLAERPPHSLSFGQKKRVSIAGVLAMEPGVLLLDEPTAGLDPEACEDLLETLAALAASGTAVVVATHTMDEAWAWADRIALFGGQRIVACGPPEAIFRDLSLLETLHLREPLLFGVARRLADAGLLPPGHPLPRTQAALFSLLSQGT